MLEGAALSHQIRMLRSSGLPRSSEGTKWADSPVIPAGCSSGTPVAEPSDSRSLRSDSPSISAETIDASMRRQRRPAGQDQETGTSPIRLSSEEALLDLSLIHISEPTRLLSI